MSDKIYHLWRKYEAYQCPMTKEGMLKAEERCVAFSGGFKAGYQQALEDIMKEHSVTKKEHSFFLKLYNALLLKKKMYLSK